MALHSSLAEDTSLPPQQHHNYTETGRDTRYTVVQVQQAVVRKLLDVVETGVRNGYSSA